MNKSVVDQINKELVNYDSQWVSNKLFLKTTEDDKLTLLLLCKENLGFEFLANLLVSDLNEDGLGIDYQLLNIEENIHLIIQTKVRKDQVVQSLTGIWMYADFYEKEAYELFACQFDSINFEKFERFLFPKHFVGHPLLNDFERFSIEEENKNKIEKAFDKQTPSFSLSQDEILFNFQLNNFKIESFDYEMGFRHFGLEKDAQGKNVHDFSSRIGYLNAQSAMTWSMLWCHSVETAANMIIPERAQGIRMVLNEMIRIKNHLYSLMKIVTPAGYSDFVMNLALWHERTLKHINALLENRNPLYYNIIGGVKFDIPIGWVTTCLEFINQLEKDFSSEYIALTKTRFFYDGMSESSLSKKDLVEAGVSGPLLRASGYNLDLRKKDPIYFYKDVSFDVPLGIEGRTYDRFLVLCEEILQSMKILFQVLDNLPAGNICESPVLVDLPQNTFVSEGWESSNGMIFTAAQVTGENISRLKISSNSQNTLRSLKQIMNNTEHEHLDQNWSSLLINMSEVER